MTRFLLTGLCFKTLQSKNNPKIHRGPEANFLWPWIEKNTALILYTYLLIFFLFVLYLNLKTFCERGVSRFRLLNNGIFCTLHKHNSMTSLFAHKVAKPTNWRFLPKNLSQLVIFVIGLAFTWSRGDKNRTQFQKMN